MLTYADVFGRMRTFADICSGSAEGGMGMMGGMMNNKDEQALTDDEREEVKKLWQARHILNPKL
jgi:hypothetical protein